MKKERLIQFLSERGKPQWAILPYHEYVRLQELDSLATELKAFKKSLVKGEEELIPHEFAIRLIHGESPLVVWREYRGFSQTELAKKVKISRAHLCALEKEHKKPSIGLLKILAATLRVKLDDLV